MKLLITCLAIVFTVISCKDKKQTTEKSSDSPTTSTTVTTVANAPDPAADSSAIRALVIDFYNWYNKNYKKFETYNLYSGIKKKDTPPYKINWDQVEKYQNFIRSSVPQLGEVFLENQKRFFQECDSAFKVDKEDEVPYGFDYDWYTNSQEDPQYTLDEMNKAKQWIIKVNGDDATADVKGADASVIKLALKKENARWKIAKIENN